MNSPEEWEELHRFFPVTRVYRQRLESAKNRADLDLAARLRLQKTEDFLQVVTDTHFQKRSAAEIHLNWSMTTESRLQTALMAVADEAGQRADPPWAVFAYGKLGSFELNLSSDVDLVWIRAPGRAEDTDESNTMKNNGARQLRHLLADVTEWGFAHRLDFDLRAGGRLGPLVSGLDEWTDYFSNFGEAWERLAFVRFRPIWGSADITTNAMAASAKFTYRRYLDFSLMESFKELRQKIHEQNWTRSKEGQIDLKLGLGGIRDLELFVHTLQVVYGGKSQAVRLTSTTGALQELQKIGALTATDAEFLETHYWHMRQLENLVQAREDQQTHILIESDWRDYAPTLDLKLLREGMQHCQEIVTGFLGPVDPQRRSLPDSETDRHHWLQGLGLREELIESVWKPLLEQEVFSRQKDRDDRWRKAFLYQALERASQLGLDVNELLPRLSEFVRKIRAKATLFHLLAHRPELIGHLVRLMSQSDYLGQILIHRPELLDSFIYQQRPEIGENLDKEQMHQILRDQKLLSELGAGLDFLASGDLESVLKPQTSTADSICQEILRGLKREFHSDLEILALGKWGAGELGLASDLDFIFISSRVPEAVDHQIARRFLTFLTQSPTLYPVDLRLKPNSGVLVTTWDDLHEFLLNEAPAWQRQVYLRSRTLDHVGPDPRCARIFQDLADRGLSETELAELEVIRQNLIAQNAKKDAIKFGAGGLVEIELAVQTAILFHRVRISEASTKAHFQALEDAHPEWKKQAPALWQNYRDLRKLGLLKRVAAGSNSLKIQDNSSDLMFQNTALLQLLDPRQGAR
ncbi:MAG: hypothetical protein KF767_03800 [Bdellovibrionaceae bacterium]|nr:hypothetical protein [Pseudobdellovibrionaceae bacterium]